MFDVIDDSLLITRLRSQLDVVNASLKKINLDLSKQLIKVDGLEEANKRLLLEGDLAQLKADNCVSQVSTLKKLVVRLQSEIKYLSETIERARENKVARENVEHLISHDLRGAAVASVSIPNLLMSDGNLTCDQVELLDGLRVSALRILKMLDMNRDLYRIETNEYVVGTDKLSLESIIDEALKETHGSIVGKKLIIEKNYGEAASLPLLGPLVVNGDMTLLVSAFYNVIVNAVQASPVGGVIAITVVKGDMLSVAIMNSGEVPPNIRANFFDKFVTSGKEFGTGIGTYSAMLIVNAHCGDILLDTSVPGRTTLTVLLPITD
ncbi:hypothetical protein JCM15519_23130 [Fundidesulfovibrio butyratiphilus]